MSRIHACARARAHTHTVPSQPSCSISTGQNQEDCLRLEGRVKTLTNTSLCALQSQGNIRSCPCEDESPPSVLWEEPGLHPHPGLPKRGHRGPPSGQASSPQPDSHLSSSTFHARSQKSLPTGSDPARATQERSTHRFCSSLLWKNLESYSLKM